MGSAMTTAEPPLRDGVRPPLHSRAGAATPGPSAPRVGADVNARLADAARMVRQALGADHASVLLLDGLGRLVPAVAVARTDDAVLWSRFRSMPPVRLDSIPLDVSAITTGQPIVINDVQSSALVPEPWRISFGVQSAAVAPLLVDGVPRGALVVDYASWPHEFSENDVRLLEAMAAPVSYLLGVADVAEGARRTEAVLDRVTAAGRELAAARTGHAVLQAALAGLSGVLGGAECSLHVVTGDVVETLASHGPGRPDPGRYPVGGLDDVSRRALRAMEADAARPVVLPGRPGEEHVIVPMTDARDTVRAFAVVGRDRVPPLTAVELAAAGDVAAQAWQAFERAGEAARLARRTELLEAVRALAEDPMLDPDLPRIVERLAPAVRSTTGTELLDAFLLEPAAARLFATPAPPRRLAPLFRRWRRGGAVRPVVSDDVLLVPMLVDDRVVGALRVRGAADGDVPDLLCSVAGGIGAAVVRVLLRSRMAEHERGLAVAEERERVARDLHDTLGQQLFALRVELEGVATTVHDRLAAAKLRAAVASVTRANADLRLAIHALSFLEQAKRGLVPSVRTLVRKIGETTPIGLQMRVVGTPVRLAHGCEEALFRVTHEALENVVRHSRASTATVTVSFSPERAAVIVRDDGTGMSARSDEQHGLHFGLRTMQRRMEEIGGGLEVSNFRPHGVCLHAWVPTR